MSKHNHTDTSVTKATIISLKDYKREHDIPLPHSPYYSLNATEDELNEAYHLAARRMREPFDYRGIPPYAALVGYKNIKTGKIKLLKEITYYSSKSVFESTAGIKDHYVLALVQKA